MNLYVIENKLIFTDHFIIGSEPTLQGTFTAEEINCGTSVVDGIIVIDQDKKTVVLNQLRAAKRAEIRVGYGAEKTTENKGIISATLGVKIDCREDDEENVRRLLLHLDDKNINDYFYQCYDDSHVDCNKGQFKKVQAEIVEAGLSMWTQKQTLLAQIAAATTVAEIETITWLWPA